MTAEQLHDALGLLPFDLIEEADNLRRNPKRTPIAFRRWAALAAAFVLVAGCGLFALRAGMLPLAGGGRTESAMDKIAMQECAPEAPAAPILTDEAPAQENIEYSRNDAAEPTCCAPPVKINEAVYLRADLPTVFTELLKSAEEAEEFYTGYDADWFRDFDLLLISLPGVGSVSDLSVGQGASPVHWEIRVTEEAPAEDALLILIPVEKGHIPAAAEFTLIWQ